MQGKEHGWGHVSMCQQVSSSVSKNLGTTPLAFACARLLCTKPLTLHTSSAHPMLNLAAGICLAEHVHADLCKKRGMAGGWEDLGTTPLALACARQLCTKPLSLPTSSGGPMQSVTGFQQSNGLLCMPVHMHAKKGGWLGGGRDFGTASCNIFCVSHASPLQA